MLAKTMARDQAYLPMPDFHLEGLLSGLDRAEESRAMPSSVLCRQLTEEGWQSSQQHLLSPVRAAYGSKFPVKLSHWGNKKQQVLSEV